MSGDELLEQRELQNKIAALQNAINLRKQQNQTFPAHPKHGFGRGSTNWAPRPGTPYGVPRGRSGRPSPAVYRNKTLVLNNNSGTKTPPTGDTSNNSAQSSGVSTPVPSGDTFVSKRDRHMQLINTNVYDKISQQRTQNIQDTQDQKQRRRNEREKARLNQHFQKMPSTVYGNSDAPQASGAATFIHQVQIEGIPFQVVDGGSKLIRMSSESTVKKATPKLTKIAGVTFLRSTSGNLYRAGLVKAKKNKSTKKMEPCPRFTSTGTCPQGPNCRYIHDPHKVAICKDFLQKGVCPLGDGCDLSHECTPHRVPTCLHFLRGNCTNDHCRYAHVRVNPSAPVCRAFATIGYCDKGAQCAERHIFECPDYANKGLCRNTNCRLPHVDRAGQIRKVAGQTAPCSDEDTPDLTSDEEDFDSDIDSDGLDEEIFMIGTDNDGHELSQQQDFIGFRS